MFFSRRAQLKIAADRTSPRLYKNHRETASSDQKSARRIFTAIQTTRYEHDLCVGVYDLTFFLSQNRLVLRAHHSSRTFTTWVEFLVLRATAAQSILIFFSFNLAPYQFSTCRLLLPLFWLLSLPSRLPLFFPHPSYVFCVSYI